MRHVPLNVLALLASTALISGCSTDGAPQAMGAGSAVNAPSKVSPPAVGAKPS